MRNTVIGLAALAAGCYDFKALSSGFDDLTLPSADGGPQADMIGSREDLEDLSDLRREDGSPEVADLDTPEDLAKVDAGTCAPSLANVGAGDFRVHFRVSTRANVGSTLVYQRARCDLTGDFWNVYTSPSGEMVFEVGQANAGYASLKLAIAVNDGAWHTVDVQRKGSLLSSWVDGRFAGGGVMAPWKLGALPPLGTVQGFPCEGNGMIVPLNGAVDAVCLYL